MSAPPKKEGRETEGRGVGDDCFALPPGVDWTPVDDALSRLETALSPVTVIERRPLAEAEGRVLGEDAIAKRAHPACDNAAVDGYAFRHPGAGAPLDLRLALEDGRAAPGAPWDGALADGRALRILTGAAMPRGADTVVLQEDVRRDGGALSFRAPKKPGANSRLAGENVAVGQSVLKAGALLTPQALAQLAAAGATEAALRTRLRVGLLSTGDELIEPGEPGRADQVIDSNRPMLAALLGAPWIDRVDLGRAQDRREAAIEALDRGAAQADALLTTGGASGGDEDHIAAALQDAAAPSSFHLWRIAMKPGRPLAMGTWRGKPVFGLPGNPVAAFVCFFIFVRPALMRLAGGPFLRPRALKVECGFDYPKKPGRREYLRARVGADGRLEKYRSEGSGLIEGLIWSDGLVDLPHDAGPIEAGAMVDYLSYAALGAPQ